MYMYMYMYMYIYIYIHTQSYETDDVMLNPEIKKMLVVTVVEATGLIAADASGTSDPFVTLTVQEEDEKDVRDVCM